MEISLYFLSVTESDNCHAAESIPSLTVKGKRLGLFCFKEKLWDSVQPANKIYGKGVFIADLVLIVSQLSKNPILLNEAAIGFIYWIASKNLFSVESGQVSRISGVLLRK